jgi:hypothetical protein
VTRRDEGSLAVEAIEGSANLLDQTKQIWQRTLGDIAPLVVIGMAMGRRLGTGEAADPLAVALAAETMDRLERPEPDVLAAYVALEIAAARVPTGYGYVFRRYREWLMRALLGVARGRGILASVRETTLPERCWTSTRSQFWVLARGDQLVLYRGRHQVAVLDLDRGMRDEFDA